jgi:hypothetical protein
MKRCLQILCALLLSSASFAANLSASAGAADKGKNNGFINLTISGGFAPYVISWSGPSGYSSSKLNPDSLAAGRYCVVVTDAYCGVASLCIDVTEKTNTGLIEQQTLAFKVYPNPCSRFLNIEVKNAYSGMLDIQLYDVLGRLMVQQNVQAQSKINWPLPITLPVGSYLLRLQQEDGNSYTQRILTTATE